MNSFKISGLLFHVGQPQTFGKTTKVEITVARTDSPSSYGNYVVDVTGELIAQLGTFKIGQLLTLAFTIQCRHYNGKDGQQRHMTVLHALSIEPADASVNADALTTTPVAENGMAAS